MDAQLVAALALASGVAATFAGCRPTAWRPTDLILTAALAAVVCWAGASAPWWLLAIGAFVAIAASSGVWVVVGVAAFLLAALVGSRNVSWPVVRAASAGLTIVCLLYSRLDAFFGASALLTGAVAVAIVGVGLARRGRYARHIARRLMLGVAIAGGVAVLGALIASVQAYSALQRSVDDLGAAATALRTGDFDAAGKLIENSQKGLRKAEGALDKPWVRPALAVPVLAQHVDAARKLVTAGGRLTAVARTSVTQINPDSLTVRSGVVDLVGIELLETPLQTTATALAAFESSFEQSRSPWLLGPFDHQLASLQSDVGGLSRQTEVGINAVRVAPSMLGKDGPRTYFIAFTTPSEARGLGGFMGSWAEMKVDAGKIQITRTGPTIALTTGGTSPKTLTGPADFMARYGGFGAGVDGGPMAVDFWSNVTMSPDFPSTAQVFSQLYPQSGGTKIDGAIAVDINTLAAFLSLTGPVDIPEVGQLGSSNVVDYIVRGQYERFAEDADRDAALAALTDATIRAVFTRSLPGPRVLAEALGPALQQRRVMVWSKDATDQQQLAALGIDGALTKPAVDGIAVAINNAGANKLDTYLLRNLTYEATVDQQRGTYEGALTVRLTNNVPANLPTYVAGNPYGLPYGTNRMYLSIYSPARLTAATLDEQVVPLQSQTELDWWVYSAYVDVAPGQERVLRLTLAGEFDPATPYQLWVRPQPGFQPETARVRLFDTPGRLFAERMGTLTQVLRLPKI